MLYTTPFYRKELQIKNLLTQKKKLGKKNLELNTPLSIDMRITRLKISQLGKKLGKENLNIKKRFKRGFFIRVEKKNFWICQLIVR